MVLGSDCYRLEAGRSLFEKPGATQTADCGHWLLHEYLLLIALLTNAAIGRRSIFLIRTYRGPRSKFTWT